MLNALIFDFDGLLVDTEEVRYESWQEIYASYGKKLPLELYLRCVGSSHHMFNPYDYLEEITGTKVNRDEILKLRDKRNQELCDRQPLMDGVDTFVAAGLGAGLALGVASSSPRVWVEGHLRRLELFEVFDAVLTREDVSEIKPHPMLYLDTAAALGVAPGDAVAFEDSLNGIRSSQAAGMFCVAVPNAMTRHLSLDAANLQVPSLAELRLEELSKHLG